MTDAAGTYPAPIDPSLPALRRARRVALVVIAVVVAISVTQHATPSLTGTGLGASLSLAVLAAANLTLVRRAGATSAAITLAALIVASASLLWLQPGGTGMAGLFVAVAFAGIELPHARSIFALALAAAAFVAPPCTRIAPPA